MFCTNCGHKYTKADTDFCTRCGAKVTTIGSHGAGSAVLNKHKNMSSRTLIAGILAAVAVVSVLIFALMFFGDSDEEGHSDLAERQDEVATVLAERNGVSGDIETEYISSPDLVQHGRWREEYLSILSEMHSDLGLRTIVSEHGTQYVLQGVESVSLIDLTNDGIPELVFTTAYMNPPYYSIGFTSFYVYSYLDGRSSRVAYVEQMGLLGMGDMSVLRYVYSKGDSTVVASTGSDMPWPTVRRTYHVFNDITQPPEVIVHEWRADDAHWSYEESGYFIDETRVTEEEFYAEQHRIFDGVEHRLNLSGREPRAGATDISMSFDEAISYLGQSETPAEFVQDAPRHDIPAYITIQGEQYCTRLTTEFSRLAFPPSSSEIYSLRYLVNLETLALSTFEMTDADVALIGELTNLTSLFLSHRDSSRISNIAPIGNLRNLRSLDLAGFNIVCIAPLAGLTKLEFLNLGNNQISDLSPLASMTNLTTLWLNHNQIADIRPLANLTSLVLLVLELNYITDITPLVNMTNLTSLYITRNQITDITPLSGLHNLNTLWIAHNQISDVSPLASLVNLSDRLDLTSNLITDVAPLAGLVNVRMLFLDYNPITDISPFARLPYSIILYLRGNNQITDWSPVSHIHNVFGP